MSVSRYFKRFSQELTTLRDKLYDAKIELKNCKREIDQLRRENQRLNEASSLKKHVETQMIVREDHETEKMLRFRIQELTSEKDIIELQLDESRQENEALRTTFNIAESINRDDSDLDEAGTNITDALLHNFNYIHIDPTKVGESQTTNILDELRDSAGIDPSMFPEINDDYLSSDTMKHMIIELISTIKVQRRQIKRLIKNEEIHELRNMTKPTFSDSVNFFQKENIRLTTELASQKLENSNLHQNLINVQKKLQQIKTLESEVTELRRYNWDLECQRMDIEFSYGLVLEDASDSIKFMKKVLLAANPLLQLWNATGKPISPMVGSDFYKSFEQIGFFLQDVKNYEAEMAKVESKMSKKQTEVVMQAKEGATGGSTTPTSDSEISEGTMLPNQRYRKVYRRLKREYDELRVKHQALIERYRGIKSGLTQAMYETAIKNNQELSQKKEQRRKVKTKKLVGKKPKEEKMTIVPEKKKIIPEVLTCDEESFEEYD